MERNGKYFPVAYFLAAGLFEFLLLVSVNGIGAVAKPAFWVEFFWLYPVVVLGAWFPGIRHVIEKHYGNKRLAELLHDPLYIALFVLFLAGISPTQDAVAVSLLFGMGALSHFLVAHPVEKVAKSLGAAMVVPAMVAGTRGALQLLLVV